MIKAAIVVSPDVSKALPQPAQQADFCKKPMQLSSLGAQTLNPKPHTRFFSLTETVNTGFAAQVPPGGDLAERPWQPALAAILTKVQQPTEGKSANLTPNLGRLMNDEQVRRQRNEQRVQSYTSSKTASRHRRNRGRPS